MRRDADRSRREARPWRLLFVVYWLALTVGTHWPALGLGTEAQPAPDKLIHMLAFGVLTFLLSRTRWMGSPWFAGLALLLWTGLDELTQGIGVLRRYSTFQDMLAGMLGVCLVTVWLWALGPIGGRANRVRLRWRAFIFADLFCRRDGWIAVGAAAAGGGALVGAITWLSASGTRHALTIVFVAATVGAMSAAGGIAGVLYNRHARRLSLQRPCFACGSSCRGVAFDDFGRGRCPVCGGTVHCGQWSHSVDERLLTPKVRSLVIAVAASWITYWIVMEIVSRLGLTRDLVRWFDTLAGDLQLAVHLTGMGLIVAVTVRLYRFQLSDSYDGQHVHCRACHHSLLKTPLTHGSGVCGECGREFVRIAPDQVME